MWRLRAAGAIERDPQLLPEGEHLVGRAPECAVHLDNPRISRHHARLQVSAQGVRVYDLGSRNGVFLNGRRISDAAASGGDRLGFGPLEFSLEREGEAPAAAAAGPETEEFPSQILERGRLAAAPPPDTRRLQVLYAVVETLVGNLRLEEILPSVLGTLRELFAYDRCAVAGRDETGNLVTWASRPAGATPLSRSVADRVLETGEALLCDDVRAEFSSRLGRRPLPHDAALTRAALRAVLEKACAAAAPGGAFGVALDEAPGGWSVRVGAPGGERVGDGRRDFFDPYFRTHPWADDLGLTLAAVAMARQGGSLRLGAEPGEGTDFELLLSASAPQEVR